MQTLDWFMILAYFVLLAGVVLFTMKRQKIESGEEDTAYQFRTFNDLMTIVNTKMNVSYIKK